LLGLESESLSELTFLFDLDLVVRIMSVHGTLSVGIVIVIVIVERHAFLSSEQSRERSIGSLLTMLVVVVVVVSSSSVSGTPSCRASNRASARSVASW